MDAACASEQRNETGDVEAWRRVEADGASVRLVCTLTSPRDAKGLKASSQALAETWKGSRAPLTEDQCRAARCLLANRDFLSYDMRESAFSDPPIPSQCVSLFSFVPSSGARPDKDGVFGYAKIRGTFATESDSMAREEALLRDSDSYHAIVSVRTGHPFPVVEDASAYSATTRTVDAVTGMAKGMDEARRDRERETKREVDEIRQREAALLERNRRVERDGEEDPVDPEEAYTTLRMKRAQLLFAFTEARSKLEEVRRLARAAAEQVLDSDKEHPELRHVYLDRIRTARESTGMTCDFSEESFMRFLGDDTDVDAILRS